MDLFEAVEQAYAETDSSLTQKELYTKVAEKLDIDPSNYYGRVGKQNQVNLFARKVRWVQQSLKANKLLVQVERGVWELTGKGKQKLHVVQEAKSIIAMSTSLGIMICSKAESVFDSGIIEEDIDLVVTSPPYVLQNLMCRR